MPRKPPTETITPSTLPSLLTIRSSTAPMVSLFAFLMLVPISFLALMSPDSGTAVVVVVVMAPGDVVVRAGGVVDAGGLAAGGVAGAGAVAGGGVVWAIAVARPNARTPAAIGNVVLRMFRPPNAVCEVPP